MKVKLAFISLVATFMLGIFSSNAIADLAEAYDCQRSDSEQCKFLLIGAIDAAYANGKYCPDGKTSYGYLIDSWKRDLAKYPDRKSIPTYKSMVLTIKTLGLGCRN